MNQLKIISAGAGSGKTYRLMQEMVRLLKSGEVRPEGIIATTFTKKAAAELEERVRVQLLEEGLSDLADRLTGALIGTVHGLGVKLLRRFCFEAGVSPNVDIIADGDHSIFFNQSLSNILKAELVEKMEQLTQKMSLRDKMNHYDWRQDVKAIVDRARANGFSIEQLEESRDLSVQSLMEFLPTPSNKSGDEWDKKLYDLLLETHTAIDNNEADSTKTTSAAKDKIKEYIDKCTQKGKLSWYDWASISKLKIGKKSADLAFDLMEYAGKSEQHPNFLADVTTFIHSIFDVAIQALAEYEKYKQQRGLIDYIDMETHVKRLLQNKSVHKVLLDEIDLLMVDEFQDTSPIQLEIFWKLTQMANHSIWVGDPKQSIYGFRGAAPELMQAIIDKNGGIRPEDIQEFSWRSREDLVDCSNAIFTQAFKDLPEERIALKAKRTIKATADSANAIDEPQEMGTALIHWHFEHEEGGKRVHGKPWMETCIARNIRHLLEEAPLADRKNDKYSPIKPKDIAVLCRSNNECQIVAEALNHQGLKASISRTGLLGTPEAILVVSCLKYLLNPNDTLAIAELVFLASQATLQDIVKSRIEWIDIRNNENSYTPHWEKDNPYIQKLDNLRTEVSELSGTEILNLVIEELDLNRIIVRWGNPEQRCDNLDMVRHFAQQYEESCNRLHTGASLGGFLLWLYDLASNDMDYQSSSEQEDAVNVMTYHRSKGLEWSVVVMHSLEGRLRDNVWGAQVVAKNDTIDLEALSANRFIRFWKHPYGKQFQNTALQIRVDESETKQTAIQKALEEESRLLYVGITRARDYLVFTSRKKPMLWLNRVYHGLDNETQDLLSPDSYTTPWIWKGKELITRTKVEILPKAIEHHPLPADKIQALAEKSGAVPQRLPYLIQEEQERFSSAFKWNVAHQDEFGFSFKPIEDITNFAIAQLLSAYIAGCQDKDATAQFEMAQRLLDNHRLAEEICPTELAEHCHRFIQWAEQLSPTTWQTHYPIQLLKEGRKFTTHIDCLLVTDTEIHAIQHHPFLGDHKQWKNKAKEHITWFYLVHLALKQVFPKHNIHLWQHFILKGGVQEVEVTIDG